MDELVKKISEKIGIPEDQARKAVIIVGDYLKKKLPPPFAAQVEGIINLPTISEEEARDLGLFQYP